MTKVTDWSKFLTDSLPNLFRRAGSSNPSSKLADRLVLSGLYETEPKTMENMDSLTEELKTWIKENSSPRNSVLLDLLLKEKTGTADTPLRHKLRRDGTPSQIHEITQAIRFIRDFEDGMPINNPDRVLGLIIAHDLGEDFGYQPHNLKEVLLNAGIPDNHETEEFLKEFKITSYQFRSETGYKKGKVIPNYENKSQFINAIHQNENTSIAKFYDNTHNIDTAIFGFQSKEQAIQYVATIKALLPPDKMKTIMETFPEQKDAYKQLKLMLSQSCRPVWNWLAGNIGQDLDMKPENKIKGQTPLPGGLDTPEVGLARMQIYFDIQKDLCAVNNQSDNTPPMQ